MLETFDALWLGVALTSLTLIFVIADGRRRNLARVLASVAALVAIIAIPNTLTDFAVGLGIWVVLSIITIKILFEVTSRKVVA